MFTLLRIVSSTTVSESDFTYVLISFSHGYSATLAAKLIIKLDLTKMWPIVTDVAWSVSRSVCHDRAPCRNG